MYVKLESIPPLNHGIGSTNCKESFDDFQEVKSQPEPFILIRKVVVPKLKISMKCFEMDFSSTIGIEWMVVS